ncbi:MAG TPA: kynureninase, partial [Gemmatimonadaceae bacterium]|nr:kynureninase [Gemmatimonadaceae bacterium]
SKLITRGDLETLDHADPLRNFRDRFFLPDGIVYLDGNSLGAMPKAVPERMREVVEDEWGRDLVRSWNIHGWIDIQKRIGVKIGRLIGAREDETIVADSTSINLFKTLAASLELRPDRRVIISERSNFPTDLYMAEGLIRHLGRGHTLRLVEPDEIETAITDDVAVVMLTQVNYRTGRMHDMRRITELAHARGAIMLWDLAHSAGAVPIDVTSANVDFAVGCGYKYLNGGPGAPAFLYVAKRHQSSFDPVLSGWHGHATPFTFEPSYHAAEGIERMAVGAPAILSLIALEVGIDLMLEVSQSALRAKSLQQTSMFDALVEQEIGRDVVSLVTPREPAMRGSQLCYSYDNAWPVMRALIARGVIGDFRAPDILRFGFTPLYLGFAELWDAVATLKDILATRAWDKPEHHARAKVT